MSWRVYERKQSNQIQNNQQGKALAYRCYDKLLKHRLRVNFKLDSGESLAPFNLRLRNHKVWSCREKEPGNCQITSPQFPNSTLKRGKSTKNNKSIEWLTKNHSITRSEKEIKNSQSIDQTFNHSINQLFSQSIHQSWKLVYNQNSLT